MPRWYVWLAGGLATRAVWTEVSPLVAVVLAAGALIGYWGYRVVVAAVDADGPVVPAGRREVRRILSEIGDVALGWGLIILAIFAIAGVIALWPELPLLDVALATAVLALLALAIWKRNALGAFWREADWEDRVKRMKSVLEAWDRHALSTRRPDRGLVESVLADVYRRRGRLPAPVVWAASPPEFKRQRARMTGYALHERPPSSVSMLPAGNAFWLWHSVWSALDPGAPEEDVATALAAAEGVRRLEQLVKNATWFALRDGAALVLDRPLELHVNDDGDLHNASGAAIRFSDGFALWALEGVLVPGEAIEDPDSFDARQALDEDNLEVRRLLLDHLGWERVVRDCGLQPLAEDDEGRLWFIPHEWEEPIVILEVVDATVRPDGTSRRYFLRVPPDIRSPREAAAWTFGLDEHEYAPDTSS